MDLTPAETTVTGVRPSSVRSALTSKPGNGQRNYNIYHTYDELYLEIITLFSLSGVQLQTSCCIYCISNSMNIM